MNKNVVIQLKNGIRLVITPKANQRVVQRFLTSKEG